MSWFPVCCHCGGLIDYVIRNQAMCHENLYAEQLKDWLCSYSEWQIIQQGDKGTLTYNASMLRIVKDRQMLHEVMFSYIYVLGPHCGQMTKQFGHPEAVLQIKRSAYGYGLYFLWSLPQSLILWKSNNFLFGLMHVFWTKWTRYWLIFFYILRMIYIYIYNTGCK